MKPYNFSATAGTMVVYHANALMKLEATINAAATAGLFVQVHDFSPMVSPTTQLQINVPEEGAVPVKWWPAAQAGYKEFKNGELRLTKGMYVCLSSTGPTKTLAVGGSDLMDALEVEMDKADEPSGAAPNYIFRNLLTTNNFTTTARLAQIKADASLVSVPAWLMLFFKSSVPVAGDIPALVWSFPAQDLVTRIIKFGNGLEPSPNYTNIYLRQSSSGVNYQPPATSAICVLVETK